MNWQELNSEIQVDEIVDISASNPVLIFKHSTSCSISSMVLSRFERHWKSAGVNVDPFILNLLKFRAVSNYVSNRFNITHESPQVLVIKEGKCIYHASHNAINVEEILKHY
jgi:bacillithiol system protein YtxJ